ncbi:hypothetical protein L210DRAFT_3385227 [Boletus edulis BED1]|uniref:CxC5 like cysteine cluster associated with KDZ domain-containing protein n=1 Tax=Boletus edulis BED1 TaxID=1328754 RepID=A0AAD4C876_BOLED|nr:hypothetical protein L210DRAFT_3385227 [Boletus edulis BED1]
MATLSSLHAVLQHDEALRQISLRQLASFVQLGKALKRDILLVQTTGQPEDQPPDFLSNGIAGFLKDACNLQSIGNVASLWTLLKTSVWFEQPLGLYEPFRQHGHVHGILPHALYPPHHTCKNMDCQRSLTGQLLTTAIQRDALLYTLGGVVATKHVQLHCESCKVTYHHNFYVKGDHRHYYDCIPDIIQVATHVFLEQRLIDLFDSQANLAWTSFTNSARLYNLTLSTIVMPASEQMKFKVGLTQQNVWDGFVIKALLLDCQQRQAVLITPKGEQKDRFTELIKDRNLRIQMYGQHELKHFCNKCTRFRQDENVTEKTSVVVIDGVTIGHPCCASPHCHIPLASNRHRFCPQHAPTHDAVCSIVGCTAPTSPTAELPQSQTCALPEHKAVETMHRLRNQSRFQLQERLQRARVAHPNDAVAEEIEDIGDVVDGEEEDEYELPGAAHRAVPRAHKLRAQFSRRRTHNEQLFVAPCGIIITQETFFHAEGVKSVVDMIKHVYHDAGMSKPNHIFFDNNCTLSKMVRDDPFFEHIGLSVDVFHFKCKHSQTDTWCQTKCNPAAFPELLGEGSQAWYFNSSVAEQTNVWVGGYHSICREMLAERYCFFLDEMIMRRNKMTKEKLRDQEPGYWPS